MILFLHLLLIAAQIVLVVGLADFVAGVVHWAEDAYFTEETPLIGPTIIVPNIVHHHLPRYFTRLSWWESSAELVLAGLGLIAVAWPLGLLSWQLFLFVGVSVNANEIHKMAHRTRNENGRFISKLQDWHILQTPRHHGLHHADPKNTFYCPGHQLREPAARADAVLAAPRGAHRIAHRRDSSPRHGRPRPGSRPGVAG